MSEKITVSNIHSYIVFANIDKRDGSSIKGHRVLLTKNQLSAIEDIIATGEVFRVAEEHTYELED